MSSRRLLTSPRAPARATLSTYLGQHTCLFWRSSKYHEYINGAWRCMLPHAECEGCRTTSDRPHVVDIQHNASGTLATRKLTSSSEARSLVQQMELGRYWFHFAAPNTELQRDCGSRLFCTLWKAILCSRASLHPSVQCIPSCIGQRRGSKKCPSLTVACMQVPRGGAPEGSGADAAAAGHLAATAQEEPSRHSVPCSVRENARAVRGCCGGHAGHA